MKRLLLPAGLLLSVVSASAAPCLPGTLQNYINLGAGGCQLGAALFNNFGTAPGQSFATPINPLAIQVTPGGSTFAPTLLLTLNSTAGAGDLFEAFFRFNVAAQLFGASLALGAPSATGDGAAVGVLDVCAGGSFAGISPIGCAGTAASRVVFRTAADSQLSDSATFPITSFFDVFVDLTADGGLSGTATLSTATVGVSIVPEPSTSFGVVAGIGMLIIGGARRLQRARLRRM